MPLTTVSLTTANSTTPGPSRAIELDWIGGKPATVALSFGGSSTVTDDVVLQISMDDLQRTASSLVTWMTLSSAVPGSANSTSQFHLASSTWSDVPYLLTFRGPVCAIRMNSTTLASTGGLGSLNLRLVQGESGEWLLIPSYITDKLKRS